MTHRIIYVGGPYTHPDHDVRRWRFEALTRAAAALVRQGHIVYSPITHTHPIDLHFVRDDVHLSSDFWCDFDETFMSVCTEMAILPLEGWDRSSGVKRERAYFEARGLPVWFVTAQGDECDAQGIEAATAAETGADTGLVHESPVPDRGCAQ